MTLRIIRSPHQRDKPLKWRVCGGRALLQSSKLRGVVLPWPSAAPLSLTLVSSSAPQLVPLHAAVLKRTCLHQTTARSSHSDNDRSLQPVLSETLLWSSARSRCSGPTHHFTADQAIPILPLPQEKAAKRRLLLYPGSVYGRVGAGYLRGLTSPIKLAALWHRTLKGAVRGEKAAFTTRSHQRVPGWVIWMHHSYITD